MIKLIDENINDIFNFPNKDIYSIRIKSLLKAYGTAYDFAKFYCQYNSVGCVCAIMSKLDNDFTISISEACDKSEITEFLMVIGYGTVLCDSSLDINSNYTEGIVMSCSVKKEISFQHICIDEYPKLMDLFNFADYDKSDFESWYVDISHRIRHDCAKAYTLNINDEIISSAIYSSIYENDAVLSAVKTEAEFRRMGYGGALVSYMLCDVKGTVHLMRDQNRNEAFYLELGFKNTGIWRLYK